MVGNKARISINMPMLKIHIKMIGRRRRIGAVMVDGVLNLAEIFWLNVADRDVDKLR